MSKTNKSKYDTGTVNRSKSWTPIPPEILEGILRGDESAFTEYYAGVIDALVSFVTRMTGDANEALNIAHDALVKLWECREEIGQLSGGFVYTVATRDSIDLIRRRSVHERYVNEQIFVQDGEAPAADQPVMYEELAKHYENIIGNMPPQRRRIFEMNRFDGLTYSEIAKRLGLSYNTVMTHMQLALRDLVKSAVGIMILFFLPE